MKVKELESLENEKHLYPSYTNFYCGGEFPYPLAFQCTVILPFLISLRRRGLKMALLLEAIDLCPSSAAFFGFMGVSAALVFSSA